MKSSPISIETLLLISRTIQAIGQDMNHTAALLEEAAEAARRSEDPKAIVREVLSHLKLADNELHYAIQQASALLVVVGI